VCAVCVLVRALHCNDWDGLGAAFERHGIEGVEQRGTKCQGRSPCQLPVLVLWCAIGHVCDKRSCSLLRREGWLITSLCSGSKMPGACTRQRHGVSCSAPQQVGIIMQKSTQGASAPSGSSSGGGASGRSGALEGFVRELHELGSRRGQVGAAAAGCCAERRYAVLGVG
jgi:hypothetical protein